MSQQTQPRGKTPRWFGQEPYLKSTFEYSNLQSYRSRRLTHLEMAGQLLRKLLVRRDYSRAFKLYSCLAMYKNRSEQLVWKVGAEILMQKKDYEPLCLRFLQLIFVKSTYCKEAILVETALYQLRCGMIEDAHTTLEPYIALHPYRDNALLQGYAGVIEFALWLKAVRRKLWQQQNKEDAGAASDEDSSDNGLEYDYWLDDNIEDANEATQWDARISRHAREALMQLERSLELDCRNDMFMVYIVQLKCGRIDMTGLGSKKISWSRKAAIHETKNYLKRYCNKNNDSILALHLLAALENREKQQTLELIVERDPAADSELYVLPLLELLRQSLPIAQREIIMQRRREEQDPKAVIRRAETALHGMDVKCFRPMLQVLLNRAEFGAMTEKEEQEMVWICGSVCFCTQCDRSLDRQQEGAFAQRKGVSCFDSLPMGAQPRWYRRAASIMIRE